MEVKERTQTSTFINQQLNPSESRDVVNNLFDCYINFLKLQNLSRWEKDPGVNGIDQRVEKLNFIRQDLLEQIQEARVHGRTLRLKAKIDMDVI